MANEAAVAFGAALLGAGVGGFASSVGSMWVARREISRRARLRMYQELLPELPGARLRGSHVSTARHLSGDDGPSPNDILPPCSVKP